MWKRKKKNDLRNRVTFLKPSKACLKGAGAEQKGNISRARGGQEACLLLLKEEKSLGVNNSKAEER